MWNIIQLQKQTEANRDGINKLMQITTDILEQLSGIDEFKDGIAGYERVRVSVEIGEHVKRICETTDHVEL